MLRVISGLSATNPLDFGVCRSILGFALLRKAVGIWALLLLCGCGVPTDELTGAQPGWAAADRYVHLTPEQLSKMLADKDFVLINTHTPYDYEIAGTDASIPLDSRGQWLSRYPADKRAKIVLYCRSGQRSTAAALALVASGYENVWHLDGGMVAWDRAGLPLVRR